MKPFEYLEHTADAKFRAYGATLEEAFSNAALATFNIIIDTKTVKPEITKKIHVKAKNKEALLFDFIDELIYLLSVDGFLLHEVEKLKVVEGKELENTEEFPVFELTATVTGDSHKHYKPKSDIKAATYNEMLVEEKPGKVMLQMVVDV